MQMTFPSFSPCYLPRKVQRGLPVWKLDCVQIHCNLRTRFFFLIPPSLYHPMEERGLNQVSETPNVLSVSPSTYTWARLFGPLVSFGKEQNRGYPAWPSNSPERAETSHSLQESSTDCITDVPNKKEKKALISLVQLRYKARRTVMKKTAFTTCSAKQITTFFSFKPREMLWYVNNG